MDEVNDPKVLDLRERFKMAAANDAPVKTEVEDPADGSDEFRMYDMVFKKDDQGFEEVVQVFGKLVVTPMFVVVLKGDNDIVFGSLFDNLKYVQEVELTEDDAVDLI